MRAKWLSSVAGVVLAVAGISQGAFVFTTSRVVLPAGSNFAGKDGVALFVQDTGNGTGSNLIFYDVSLSSSAASPKFFIHTWDGFEHNTANPSANNQADFGWQGFVPGDSTRDGQVSLADLGVLTANFGLPNRTWTTSDFTNDGQVSLADFGLLTSNFGGATLTAGSYVRFGGPGQFDQFFPLGTTPSENSQTYADGQSVTGFEVGTLTISSTTSGLVDTAATQLAFAVVPTGQSVTFSGQVGADQGAIASFTITDAGSGLMASAALVPEPTSIGLISLATLALCGRKRRMEI